jgi:hypothetical protein
MTDEPLDESRLVSVTRFDTIESKRMSNDDLRKFERNGRAALAAGLVALLLVGIGVWANVDKKDVAKALGGAMCAAIPVAGFGAAIGVVGVHARSLNRASLIGVGIFGLLALPILPARDLVPSVAGRLWLFIALCSLGSILSQIGAVAGGAPTDAGDSSWKMQFTLGQVLAFFIPVAIYFGYVSAQMRK